LLVVLAILTLLAVVALPALKGTLSSVNLKSSANVVLAQIDLARQTANSRNLAVDFRIYQDPAQKDAQGNPVYRLIALVIPASVSGAAADECVDQPMALQSDIIIDADPAYSSLLNPSVSTTLPPITGIERASAPYQVQNKSYVKFTFLPNGSLNLDGNVLWCLTLLNRNQARPTNGGPAANFITLVLDVPTGRARSYQP